MISKKAKKGILYGVLGGIAGFVVAVVLFIINYTLILGLGGAWRPPLYPTKILALGSVIACVTLILAIILRIKRFGILMSLIFFLISYIMTIQISRLADLPIYANECLTLWIIGSVSLSIFLMFVAAGVKRGISSAKLMEAQKC